MANPHCRRRIRTGLLSGRETFFRYLGFGLPALLAAAFWMLVALLGSAAPSHANDGAALQPLAIVTANGNHKFSVEVVDTDSTRAKGLMFRRSLPSDRGMLFIYDRAEPIGMWMRNTYISLDMLFLTADGKVHKIARRTEPFSETVIQSGGPVSAVLEVNAGTADRLGVKVGDRVCHDFFKPPC